MTSHSKVAAQRFCELLSASSDPVGTHMRKKLDVSRATLYRWRQEIDSVDTLGMLAEYFGVPITDFLKEQKL